MNVGIVITPAQVLQSLIGVLEYSIYAVALAVFVIGAFLYASSAGDDTRKNNGKEYMIGALIGFFLVRAARLIFGAALLYLYG